MSEVPAATENCPKDFKSYNLSHPPTTPEGGHHCFLVTTKKNTSQKCCPHSPSVSWETQPVPMAPKRIPELSLFTVIQYKHKNHICTKEEGGSWPHPKHCFRPYRTWIVLCHGFQTLLKMEVHSGVALCKMLSPRLRLKPSLGKIKNLKVNRTQLVSLKIGFWLL